MSDYPEQREYWTSREVSAELGASLVDALSTTHQPGIGKPARDEEEEFRLSLAATESIMRVSRGSDLSLYIVLVALFRCVAVRYVNDEWGTVLSPPYRREGGDVPEGVLVLQERLLLDETVRTAIERTRRTVLGAYSNQDVPLDAICGVDGAGHLVEKSPLLLLDGFHRGDQLPAACPMVVRFTQEESTICGAVRFDAARLRSDLVRQFCRNLAEFAANATGDFAQTVKDVTFMSPSTERAMEDWSLGERRAVPAVGLHELFEAQVRTSPDSVAVACDGAMASYVDLDRMANCVARRLHEAGLTAGDIVAVRLRPGVPMVATLLGVLKLGAAFLPISLEEPADRMRSLLAGSWSRALLSMRDEPDGDVNDRQLVIPVAQLLVGWEARGDWRPPSTPALGDAYVLHTSGSTGEPKAVPVAHSGIVNSVGWKAREYEFSGDDRILPLFGYTFDGFILNVFASLASGATVILMEERAARDPRVIAETIRQQQVSHVVAAPIVYQSVLGQARPGQLDCLRSVALAGDVAEPETLARSPHGLPISNEYGPTETSVVATFNPRIGPDGPGVIGRPVDNTNVYVLDRDRRLLPPGIVGDLYIGGVGVVRGYLAEEDLTRESFVDWRGQRLYRTGDLARWLPDGNLEYGGREERYRKIRGIRVDLAEVRRCLLDHPDVRAAVVITAGTDAAPLIGAAAVLDGQTNENELQDYLRQRLPSSSMPSRILTLSHIPLGDSGKPDVAAVRRLLDDALGVGNADLPSTEIERELADIWRTVLELDEVGVDQNFFALGGHSLTATVLLAEIHERFGVELALNEVLSRATIREFARMIASELDRSSGVAVSISDDDQAALSPAQERMVALALSQAPNMTYNLPILFELRGEVDAARLQAALRELTSRHPSLRTSFRIDGGRLVQDIANVGEVVIQRHALQSHQDIREKVRDVLAPFDLGTAPLLRVALFETDGSLNHLLFDLHHSVVDEASLTVLFEDLSRLYNGIELGEPGAPYSKFASLQLAQKDSPNYDARLARWSDALKEREVEPLRLPYDSDAPRRRTFDGDVVRADLSADVLAAIEDLCKQHQVTPFVFFLTAFGVLLFRYTGQREVVIGAPVSQRSPAFQRTVGLFLNPVPFVIEMDGDRPLATLLRDVAVGVADDLAHSTIQFEDLVRRLRVDRHYGENPLFSVALALMQGDGPRLELNGVSAERRELHNGTAKFDLTLEIDLSGHEPQLAIEYATERFRRDTAARMIANLMSLIEDMCARPEVPVGESKALSENERRMVLRWGKGDPSRFDDAATATLASLFEQQVAGGPDAVALVLGDRSLTYAELNAKANRLAHRLRLVVSPGDVVAVACGRSIAAIVGMLAVQKAGAAHLPVDPRTPPARLEQLLSDSAAAAIITNEPSDSLGEFGGTIVNVAREDLSEFSPVDLGIHRPDGIAYVLYTSGTTGKPNGAQVSQANVVRTIREAGLKFAITPSDVWSLFHNLNFDVSVWEVFGSLLHGSKLVIVPEEVALDARRFMALLEREKVTVLCQTPGAFYLLADEMLRQATDLDVRLVVLGGEAISMRRLEDWYAKYGRSV